MESQKPETKSDEIDLGQLFSRIGGGMRSAGLGFMRFLATLRRAPIENKWSFILFIVASIAIAITFNSFVRKNYFKSTMILSSDYLNKRLADNIIDKLNSLAGEKSKRGLAATLGLPDGVVQTIMGFDIEPFMAETNIVELEILKQQLRTAATDANQEMIDELIKRIEIENRHAYEITVRTREPSVIPRLEEAIVAHFRKNPYIGKRVEVNARNLNELKMRLSKDIGRMDSLKAAIHQAYQQMASQSKGSNNVIFGDKAVSNPVEVFSQSLKIYALYEEVNHDLYTQSDFEVIDGFTEFSEPANDGLPLIILEAILVGIIVFYASIGFRSFNHYLANLK